ncbi:MAG: exopolyphosphatase [Sulfurifustaceae bacterium]
MAAVDLGSNSFHLMVARAVNGSLRVIDRLQETVRLAGGLDDRGRLNRSAQTRALQCLNRFGERLRGMPRGGVRAVATAALRRARNASEFLIVAERALGHPIEIISGQEEARLIYQGVARALPDDGRSRLVIDIGGASTELIIGRNGEARRAESLHIGCLDFALNHFKKGRTTSRGWNDATTATQLELRPIASGFRAEAWESVYGTSGTIRAIGALLRARGATGGEITLPALHDLRDTLLRLARVDRLRVDGLNPERAMLLPAGVAILSVLFEVLGIERMELAAGALREGVLYDLLGRIRHADARDRSIAALTERYHVDTAQAERVQRTGALCLAQVAKSWELGEAHAQVLTWAARLHEIGLAIAHAKYHRHGAYLAAQSDLPGFSWQEQRLVAILIRAHRRRFPVEAFEELPKHERRPARRLSVLLRLAVLLHRARSGVLPPPLQLRAAKRQLLIRFPRGWLAQNPLTCADLEREADVLRAAGFELRFR